MTYAAISGSRALVMIQGVTWTTACRTWRWDSPSIDSVSVTRRTLSAAPPPATFHSAPSASARGPRGNHDRRRARHVATQRECTAMTPDEQILRFLWPESAAAPGCERYA